MFSNTQGTTYSEAKTSQGGSLSTSFFRPSKRVTIYGPLDRTLREARCFPGFGSRPRKPRSTCLQIPRSLFHFLIWVKTTPENLSRWKYRLLVHSLRGSWNHC